MIVPGCTIGSNNFECFVLTARINGVESPS